MLEALDLVAVRGARVLFAPLSLSVGSGQAVWVRGANGAGKTSLLRMLAGLARPWSGEIRWQGRKLEQVRTAWHRGLRYLGHQAPVKDELSALENLAFTACLAGRPCTTRQAHEALAQWGLDRLASLPGRSLSQGQRRRLGLAQLSLGPAPDCMVLDEPFDALDTDASAALNDVLAAHLREGAVLVYTSHLPASHQLPAHAELALEPDGAC